MHQLAAGQAAGHWQHLDRTSGLLSFQQNLHRNDRLNLKIYETFKGIFPFALSNYKNNKLNSDFKKSPWLHGGKTKFFLVLQQVRRASHHIQHQYVVRTMQYIQLKQCFRCQLQGLQEIISVHTRHSKSSELLGF